MYLYKKNIILVPADFDGISMAKGILSLDCYADKTVCSLRTYNLLNNKSLTLGIAVNKKLSKITVNGALNSQKFELPLILNNADNISIVLLDIKDHDYNIVLWGSTELNNSWRSTLEYMLSDEFKLKKQNEDLQNYNNTTQNFDNTNSQNLQKDCEQNFADKENKNNFNKYDFCNNDSFSTEQLKQNCFNTQNQDSNYDLNTVVQSNTNDNLALDLDDDFDSVELLKNQNIDNFLDSVISLEQDENMAEYDENSSHLEETKQQENTFYDRISYQIEKMFNSNQQETILDEIIPNSKFCRVEFDDKSGHYVFGIVYESQKPKYLCYGVPAKKDSEPPKELSSYYQWLPVDIENENGDGYYMMYQDALTGKNISVEII